MSIDFQQETLDDGVIKLVLMGTLDAPGAMAIEDEFNEAVEAHQDEQVIVDLSGLEYISSYGLRMLLTGAKKLHTNDGMLHLAEPNEHVMKVLTIAGYDMMFPVHDTVDEARSAADEG